MTTPFFIVGCPRSGTTLLQLLIDGQPNVAIPPESHVVERFHRLLPLYGDLSERPRAEALARDLLADERIKEWGLEARPADVLQGLERPTARDLVARLFELYAAKQGKRRWGDKTPQHALYLREVLALFPEARIVHLVRDGRDVCESLKRVFIGPKSTPAIARTWRRYVRTVEQARRDFIAPERFLQVRYEDVVLQRERELRRLMEFLGEPYTDAGGSLGKGDAQRYYTEKVPHLRAVGSSVSSDKVGIFKKKLDARTVEIFETIAGEELKSLGYELTTGGAARITPRERLEHLAEDQVLRFARKLTSADGRAQLRRDVRYAGQQKLRRLKLQRLGP